MRAHFPEQRLVIEPTQQQTIWKPVIQTECSHCFAPNDVYFLFCQQCGTPRKRDTPVNKNSPIDSKPLAARWDALENHLASSEYRRKRSALEIEFTSFLASSSPPKSLDHVSPRDIIYFLIWKDKDSKPQVHQNSCTHQGSSSKTLFSCGYPRRLAFKTVDS